MSKEKSGKTSAVAFAVLFALVAGVVVFVLWAVFNKDESIETTDTTNGSTSALECTIKSTEDAFFDDNEMQRSEYTVTVLLKDDTLSSVSYKYKGTYTDEKMAEDAEARLHAKYNNYLGGKGLNNETYNAIFNINKTKVEISLYSERKKFNNVIAPIFFVSEEDFPKVGEYSLKDFKKMYEKAGFSCSAHE